MWRKNAMQIFIGNNTNARGLFQKRKRRNLAIPVGLENAGSQSREGDFWPDGMEKGSFQSHEETAAPTNESAQP